MSNPNKYKQGPWPLSPLSAAYSTSPVSPHYTMPITPDDDVYTFDPHEGYRIDRDWERHNGIKQTPQGSGVSGDGVMSTSRESPSPSPRPWWTFGFERKLSIGLFIFFGGAILGFSLSRTELLRFKSLLKITTPGEGYWYEQPIWKPNIIIHIFTSLPASFFSVFCFLPITYTRWPNFHSTLGYITSILLVVSCVCGAVVGRHAQGGDLNVQAGVYMLASAAAGAVVWGCVEARRGNLAAHREWMLRAWFYNGTFVTTRVTALLSAQVITAINTYFSLWRCSEVSYVLKSAQKLAQEFPVCGTSNALLYPDDVYTAVPASWKGAKVNKASAIRASFGMALWVAMILHFVGIELYLRMTSNEATKLKELEEKRKNGSVQLPRGMSRYAAYSSGNVPLLNQFSSAR